MYLVFFFTFIETLVTLTVPLDVIIFTAFFTLATTFLKIPPHFLYRQNFVTQPVFFLKLLLQRHLSTIFYYRFSTFRLVLVLCVSLTSSISCNKTRKASHSNTDDNNNLTATNKEIESRVSGRGSAIDLENQAGKREEKSAILKSGREIQNLRNAVDHGLRKLEELVDVKEPLLYQMGECFLS